MPTKWDLIVSRLTSGLNPVETAARGADLGLAQGEIRRSGQGGNLFEQATAEDIKIADGTLPVVRGLLDRGTSATDVFRNFNLANTNNPGLKERIDAWMKDPDVSVAEIQTITARIYNNRNSRTLLADLDADLNRMANVRAPAPTRTAAPARPTAAAAPAQTQTGDNRVLTQREIQQFRDGDLAAFNRNENVSEEEMRIIREELERDVRDNGGLTVGELRQLRGQMDRMDNPRETTPQAGSRPASITPAASPPQSTSTQGTDSAGSTTRLSSFLTEDTLSPANYGIIIGGIASAISEKYPNLQNLSGTWATQMSDPQRMATIQRLYETDPEYRENLRAIAANLDTMNGQSPRAGSDLILEGLSNFLEDPNILTDKSKMRRLREQTDMAARLTQGGGLLPTLLQNLGLGDIDIETVINRAFNMVRDMFGSILGIQGSDGWSRLGGSAGNKIESFLDDPGASLRGMAGAFGINIGGNGEGRVAGGLFAITAADRTAQHAADRLDIRNPETQAALARSRELTGNEVVIVRDGRAVARGYMAPAPTNVFGEAEQGAATYIADKGRDGRGRNFEELPEGYPNPSVYQTIPASTWDAQEQARRQAAAAQGQAATPPSPGTGPGGAPATV